MDLLDFLAAADDPAAQAQRAADTLRNKQALQQGLQSANERANQYNILNFVAQNANNPILAKSIGGLSQAAQAQNTPVKLDKGLYVPSTGDYYESPGVAEEKEADRQQRLFGAASAAAARTQAAQSQAEARQYAADQARESRILAASIAAQGRGTNDEMARLRLQMAQDKFAQQKQDAEDKSVTKFSQTLEKAGVPEFEQALQTAENTIKNYKSGTLPGYGRILGSVPGFALSNEGQAVRADLAQAANVLLKSRSGAAVTDQEMKRFLQEVGTGGGMSEETLRRGWANLRKSFDAKKSGILAGVDDATLDAYNSRSPTVSLQRGNAKSPIAASQPSDDDLIKKYLK